MASHARPNVLFIFSDQHRYDWLGAAGCSFVDTPHLDALAARGIRFTRTYCNSPLCGPSRMSMLTGRHPYRNGVYINEHCLSSDTPTFVHSMGLAGYHTLLCGRMHFMGPDQRHGYVERLVGDICRTYPGGPAFAMGEFQGTTSNLRTAVEKAGPGDSPVLQYDRDVTAAFEDYASGYTADKPLFATVGFYSPHHTFTAPPEHYERARERMAVVDAIVGFGEKPAHPWLDDDARRSGVGRLSAEQLAEIRYNYAGMISHMDTLIGRVLDAARRLPGETVVIYASDHGEMAGDHQRVGKGCYYEAAERVPLLCAPLDKEVEWCGAPAGTSIDYPVSLLDLSPTMTELAGGPALRVQDGDSLAPFIRGQDVEPETWEHRAVFSEQELLRRPPTRMIVRDGWKLSYFHTHDAVTLYNLRDDPDELCDRGGDPACAGVRDQLTGEVLAGWDPQAMYRDLLGKMDDLDLMTRWGREVGMGAFDVWGTELENR